MNDPLPVFLDTDPDDLLPEDWDEVKDGEIADLRRKVMAETMEAV